MPPPHAIVTSASTSNEPLRVALVTVGLVRTAAHPAVVASFSLMQSSLLRDGHTVHHFMWLSPSLLLRFNENETSWQRALMAYRPTQLVYASRNESVECRPQCRVQCRYHRHDSIMNWLWQFFFVHRAYWSVRAYSDAHGLVHDWFIRLRPDLIYLQPLPSLASLSRGAAYVPRGVMSRDMRYPLNNDHLMLCPAGALCDLYFDTFARTYAVCNASFVMPHPLQRTFSEAYAPGSLRLLDYAYTIARSRGPECARLNCSSDEMATGCGAPHLVRFLPRCLVAQREWRAWQNESLEDVQSLLASAPVVE
jgi:hypothetical protein